MTTVNNQTPKNYGPDNTSGTEGKKTEKKQEGFQEQGTENKDNGTDANPYQETDNADINTDNTRESDLPVTVVEFEHEQIHSSGQTDQSAEARLYSKSEYTPDEQKIADFISDTKDMTWKAIIKSFEQMLENARKMMEEHKRYLKEKVIPREEAMKVELAKEEVQKEITNEAVHGHS